MFCPMINSLYTKGASFEKKLEIDPSALKSQDVRDPMQLYTELKIAEVISRGMLCKKVVDKKLNKIRKTLPERKFKTPDYQIAVNLLNDFKALLDANENVKKYPNILETHAEIIDKEFNGDSIDFDCEGSSAYFMGGENKRILDVRQLSQAYLSSSSEDESASVHEPVKDKREPETLKNGKPLTKTMALKLRHKIYLSLKSIVEDMKNNEELMKNDLFQNWVDIQSAALSRMKTTLTKDRNTMKSRRVSRRKTCEFSDPDMAFRKSEFGTITEFNRKYRISTDTSKRLTKKEDFFLSGVIGDGASLQLNSVNETLSRGSPSARSSLRGENGIMDLMQKYTKCPTRVVTYGDFLRLLENDGSFQAEKNESTGLGQEYTNNPGNEKLITKAMLDEVSLDTNGLFFPNPDFSFIENLLTIDENAFISDEEDVTKIHCSLTEVERRIHKLAESSALTRAIYVFHYPPTQTARNVQYAYEKYICELNRMTFKDSINISGCLLLYTNISCGVVLIEGPSLKVFNHLGGLFTSCVQSVIAFGKMVEVFDRIYTLYFTEWLSILLNYPLRDIDVSVSAGSELEDFMVDLHKLYTRLSSVHEARKKDDYTKNKMSNQQNPLDIISSCNCNRDPSVDAKKKTETDTLLSHLIPLPDTVKMILQNKNIKNICRYLDELNMQPILESDDESYELIEDSILSTYIDSENYLQESGIVGEIRKICKNNELIYNVKEELSNFLVELDKKPTRQSKSMTVHDVLSKSLHKTIEIKHNGESLVKADLHLPINDVVSMYYDSLTSTDITSPHIRTVEKRNVVGKDTKRLLQTIKNLENFEFSNEEVSTRLEVDTPMSYMEDATEMPGENLSSDSSNGDIDVAKDTSATAIYQLWRGSITSTSGNEEDGMEHGASDSEDVVVHTEARFNSTANPLLEWGGEGFVSFSEKDVTSFSAPEFREDTFDISESGEGEWLHVPPSTPNIPLDHDSNK